MTVSYQDLKHKTYLEPTKVFVESLLKINFVGSDRAHCPFHNDKTDSFRIYVNGRDEIRFHCFGACHGDWDVYDLIMRKEHCSFTQAQRTFASFLGIDTIEVHKGDKKKLDAQERIEEELKEIEEPVLRLETDGLTDKHRNAIQDAAEYYHNLLLKDKERYQTVFSYLEKRGVDEETIRSFAIGFCPSLEDEVYEGRALLKKHLHEFIDDYLSFQYFNKTSLFRVLDDQSIKERNSNLYTYYVSHIDYTMRVYGGFVDYFFNRITFPVFNLHGQIEGIIGRRLDNRGIRWLKQTQEGTLIRSKGWLYGIDKSARGIREYQTVIIVEGIFDFFAFYNILENKDRLMVVSTLGSTIDKGSMDLLADLGARHYIIAFDWDPAGRRGILDAVENVNGSMVSYLGSLKENEDPADKLKGLVSKISGFGIRHLQKGMAVKSTSGKPVMASFLVQRQKKEKLLHDEVVLKPATMPEGKPIEGDSKDFWYKKDDILRYLSYDHKNRAELNQKLNTVKSFLEEPLKYPPDKQDQKDYFSLPRKFIEDEHYLRIGDALLLHLRLAIEQQTRARKIKETDATIAGWLSTSRKTVFVYKDKLKRAGLLNIEMTGRTQRLSVNYFTSKPTSIETPGNDDTR